MDSTPPAALVASRSTQVQPIPPQPEWQCSHLITFSMEHVMPVICSCFLEFTPAHFPLVVLDYLNSVADLTMVCSKRSPLHLALMLSRLLHVPPYARSAYDISPMQQVTPEQGRMPRRLAVVCLEACPSDVLTIFKEMLGTLDLTKEDPLLGKTLIEQEDRPKSPLTEPFAGRAPQHSW